MKNLFKLLLAGSVMANTFVSMAATKAAEIPGAKYVISNIEKLLADLQARTENAFANEQGGGAVSGETDFVHSIDISDDDMYMIRIEMSRDSTEVSKFMRGKVLLLVPMIEEGSAHISSYSCLTNVDENYKAFAGDKGRTEGRMSRVSFSAENPLLRKCLYYSTAKVEQMWTTGTMEQA